VNVKPGAKREKIIQINKNTYEVCLTAKPEKGKANKELIEKLANYFKIKKTQISIIRGQKSRQKVIQIYRERD